MSASTATAPAPVSGPTGPDALGRRLVSLDAFRGATIAAMLLVNNPGSRAHIYAPLRHADWHGWTPTDLIFPFFLFIVGVAIVFSFGKQVERGADRGAMMRKVARRSLVLVVLGLLSIDSQGIETDLIGNLYSAPSAHMGALLDLGLAWSPFPYLPLDLVVGATNHWIYFDGCRSHPDLFAPYCGATSLMVLRAGLSFGIQL